MTLLMMDDLVAGKAGIALNPKRLSSAAKDGCTVEELEIASTPGRRIRILVMEQDHCLCWKFDGLRELVDFADIYALTAPRPLQCQNGLQEPPSQLYVPLAREAMKEIRTAYDDAGRPENVTLDVHGEGHVIDPPSLLFFFDKHLPANR
jgi:hypothetical protein